MKDDPRKSTDPVVQAIVAKTDRIMCILEGVAQGAIGVYREPIDNAYVLCELDTLYKAILKNSRLKRQTILEQKNKVGGLTSAVKASGTNE